MARKPAPSDSLYFTKDHEMVRQSVREFVDKEINPFADQWEEEQFVDLHKLFKKMGDLGFLGIRYGEEYGGQGLDYWFDTVFLEELGRIRALGLAVQITVQTHMCTPHLHDFGSDFIKEKYLKPSIAGDMVGAIAVTEPDAGSDVRAIKSFAKKDGDHYILNGSKIYITNGTQADYYTLLAKTSDEPGYKSFSEFVVERKWPGVTVSRKLEKMCVHISDTAELFFDNVKIPAQNLVGKEGEGFIYQMMAFQHERFSLLPFCCTAMFEMVDITLDYIKKRVVFGEPLVKKQVLRHRLVEFLTRIEGLKQSIYHIVRMKSAGMDATREISMAKLTAGRLMVEVADGCLQMFGGMGLMNEAVISRYYRDARGLSIGGGADEVMKEVVAKLEGF